MLIECPFCHARAQLPESKEGSKVRCGECGRIYGARPVGAKRGGSQTNPTPFIVGGLILVIGVVLFSVINRNDEPKKVSTGPVVEEVKAAPRGWDSPAVMAVRKLHDAAAKGTRQTILARLDGATVHAARREAALTAAEEAATEAGGEPAPLEGLLAKGWTELQGFERQEVLDGYCDEMLDASDPDSIASWTPFDGSVWSENSGIYTIRVDCTPTAGGAESRKFEWVLVEDGERFLATRWGRYIDPAEAARSIKRGPKGYEKKTLSDGSVVLEREPEPLAHLDSTPPELRKEIDENYAMIIDMSLTKEMSRAKVRLTEIGKPAVPRLLTGLYEIKLDTFENRRQANNVVQVLRDITNQYFGYAPMDEGGALGTTEERRQSSIKQWFAWWYRKGSKFTEAEKTDALDAELGEMTPEERAWLDRHKDK